MRPSPARQPRTRATSPARRPRSASIRPGGSPRRHARSRPRARSWPGTRRAALQSGLVHVRPSRELAGRSDLPGHRSGSSASLDARRFLGTAQTTLGFLREATFAAEVKVNPTDDLRRLWDWKIRGGGDGDGFLIDLTSAGNVRFIASGRNVTTDAVLPTGRFVDLLVTARSDGKINVYADGLQIGGADLPDLGINGCAAAELRFGADQDGGQRISAELDRTRSSRAYCRPRTSRAGRRSPSAAEKQIHRILFPARAPSSGLQLVVPGIDPMSLLDIGPMPTNPPRV
jgi:hypothetical protein